MLGGHSKSLLITRLRLMNHKLFLCSSNIPIPIKNSAFHFLNKQYQTSNWHPRSMVLRSVRCCPVSPGLSEKISECKVNVTSSSQSIYSNAVYWCKSRLILSRIIKYKHFFLRDHHTSFVTKLLSLLTQWMGDCVKLVRKEKMLSPRNVGTDSGSFRRLISWPWVTQFCFEVVQ